MLIALVTDLHFGARNDNLKVGKFQGKFYDEVFFPYCDANNIKTVIDLGDTFDRRKFISYTSLKAAKEMFFQPLQDKGMTLHCIVGNHDITYKNTLSVNSINLLLDGFDNIIEYSDPTEVTFDGLKMLFLPWICKENEEQSWQMVENTQAQVLMAHLELNGFQMYKGMPSHVGIPANKFGHFDQVYTGHYHHKSTSGNITYLGTAYEMTWSCYEDQKGFHIYNTETRELTFVPNPHRLFYKEFYDDTNWTYDSLNSADYSYLRDKYVKVVVKSKGNPHLFDMFITQIENNDPINVQVTDAHLHLDIEGEEDIVNEAEDTLTILDNYIDSLDIKNYKTDLQSLMRGLYSEALRVE